MLSNETHLRIVVNVTTLAAGATWRYLSECAHTTQDIALATESSETAVNASTRPMPCGPQATGLPKGKVNTEWSSRVRLLPNIVTHITDPHDTARRINPDATLECQL